MRCGLRPDHPGHAILRGTVETMGLRTLPRLSDSHIIAARGT